VDPPGIARSGARELLAAYREPWTVREIRPDADICGGMLLGDYIRLRRTPGISVMPRNHLSRAMTGMPVGKSVIMPNGYCSSSSSLTVTSSRKFGRYRASFIDRRPQDDPGYRRVAFSV